MSKKPYDVLLLAAARRRAKIRRLRDQGHPVPFIALRMGISRTRVYQILANTHGA